VVSFSDLCSINSREVGCSEDRKRRNGKGVFFAVEKSSEELEDTSARKDCNIRMNSDDNGQERFCNVKAPKDRVGFAR